MPIKYAKNDKQRVRAHCADDCPWYLFAAPDSRTKSFVVKTLADRHTCTRVWELKQFTSNYLAAKYMENFRADDKMTLRNFARLVEKDYDMTPSRSKIARARRLAMREIYGDEIGQYNLIRDYAGEIRRSNPGSTMYVNVINGHFSITCISLDACKRGSMTSCRPFICLDECHIKTKFGGQLLTVVGIDPNDCIYPFAMAVVEVEDTSSWTWFLSTLKADLGIDNTSQWTVMSDRQKGLINAVTAVFAGSEQRFCVRHLYQKFSETWKGEIFKNKLWAIARSNNMADCTRNMEEMRAMDEEAYDYLAAIDPSSWCRAYFSEFPKCDLLLNNNCEVFNK
ncbi:uncharacterized protein LOC100832325 [Brachypodium distachyon]|uniref:uncharacterized protein LOC100832325 n=1 Tax=Brachypodium distachyon TaxID=15368 RepID=UPI00053005C6|nr:uncharacterized protein LOC100832325 [Brachypodium distachyon]|eukprot:XP_010233420.1 uncharacterized protein LOC100832325 [Brachypodium distachyon]